MSTFQITFLDFPESDSVWLAVQKRVEKLERFFERIIRCEVVVSCPHRHRHSDRLYHVQIYVFLPGDDIIINRNSQQNETHRDIYIAIRDAFNAAERVLKDKLKKVRHEIKTHDNPFERGKITKIFHQEGFGFLMTNNGREYYFAENSLINENFTHLEVGQKVKFLGESGEKGPQATSMTVL